ncbi:MAG: RNA-binding protein [Bacteroidota bacterium]|nr:RNA-binding protein [Bacteroidota bacterium]MDP4255853.1 RNA-binding protein [Bacteroidota bacterium]MDP4260301.1 RNA-binding protein [Bacteroidota bacterium]
MNIRVINMSLNTTDREIRKLFSSYGIVDSAEINRNSLNGRSLKTAHINMPVEAQARQAIQSLDKSTLDGKIISVTEQPAQLY